MSQSSRWTDEAFARLEVIVREQEAARARLDAIERTWSSQRTETMATIAALSAEYDELYVALDAYAYAERPPASELAPAPTWGVTPSLPTAFDAPPVQWDAIGPPPTALEPRPRGRVNTAVIVFAITVLALGLGVMVAAIVSGRVELERVASLPAMANERVTTPQAADRPIAAAIVPPATIAAAAPPASAIAPAPVAAKTPATKRAKKQSRAKKHRKKARSKRKQSRSSSPSRRIGLPASADPLAGV